MNPSEQLIAERDRLVESILADRVNADLPGDTDLQQFARSVTLSVLLGRFAPSEPGEAVILPALPVAPLSPDPPADRAKGVQLDNWEEGLRWFTTVTGERKPGAVILLCACRAVTECHRAEVGQRLEAEGHPVSELIWLRLPGKQKPGPGRNPRSGS